VGQRVSDAEVREFRGHAYTVNSVAFSPDSRHALSVSWDRTLRLWDIETGKDLARFAGEPRSYFHTAAFENRGRFTQSLLRWTARVFKGHAGRVWSVAIGPNGRRALSGGHDDTVRLWNIETGEELARFVWKKKVSGQIGSVAFALDGRRILAAGGTWNNLMGGDDPELLLWRVPTDTEIWAWRLMGGKFPEPPESEE